MLKYEYFRKCIARFSIDELVRKQFVGMRIPLGQLKLLNDMPMKGLRRNDDAMKNKGRY